MRDFTTKINNGGTTPDGQLSAEEFNNFITELERVVSRGGLLLDESSTTQLAQSLFLHGVKALTFQDGGSANAYEVTPVSGANGVAIPADYGAMNGATIAFVAANTNTGSATLNLGQTNALLLGAKKILSEDGNDILSDSIVSGKIAVCTYNAALDSGSGAWVLQDPYDNNLRSRGWKRFARSTDYVATVADQLTIFEVDATSGPVRIQLPRADVVGARYSVIVQKTDDTANAVTVDPDNVEQINGGPELELTIKDQWALIVSDGTTDWTALPNTLGELKSVDDLARATALKALQEAQEAKGGTGPIAAPWGWSDDFEDDTGIDPASTNASPVNGALSPRTGAVTPLLAANWGTISGTWGFSDGGVSIPAGSTDNQAYYDEDFSGDFELSWVFDQALPTLNDDSLNIGVITSSQKATTNQTYLGENRGFYGFATGFNVGGAVNTTTGAVFYDNTSRVTLNISAGDKCTIRRTGATTEFLVNDVVVDTFLGLPATVSPRMAREGNNGYFVGHTLSSFQTGGIGPLGDMDYRSDFDPINISATFAEIQIEVETIANVTMGTTFTAAVRADGAASWDAVTLENRADTGVNKALWRGGTVLTTPGSGLQVRLQSSGGANFLVHQVQVQGE